MVMDLLVAMLHMKLLTKIVDRVTTMVEYWVVAMRKVE